MLTTGLIAFAFMRLGRGGGFIFVLVPLVVVGLIAWQLARSNQTDSTKS